MGNTNWHGQNEHDFSPSRINAHSLKDSQVHDTHFHNSKYPPHLNERGAGRRNDGFDIPRTLGQHLVDMNNVNSYRQEYMPAGAFRFGKHNSQKEIHTSSPSAQDFSMESPLRSNT